MGFRQPALLIFIFIIFVSSALLAVRLNYYLSYGPMTVGQESGYVLAFAGSALILLICIGSILLLGSEVHKTFLPILFNFGFIFASGILLASSVLFLNDPATNSSMKLFVLHKFIDHNLNTALMQRLQNHYDHERGALECCGVESYLDYTAINHNDELMNITHIHVPDTCCIYVEPGCGKNLDYPRPARDADPKIYQKGCMEGGIDNFMKRQDVFTYVFYHYIGYTALAGFFCSLICVFTFNVLYFCTEGNEIILEGYQSIRTRRAARKAEKHANANSESKELEKSGSIITTNKDDTTTEISIHPLQVNSGDVGSTSNLRAEEPGTAGHYGSSGSGLASRTSVI